MIWIAQLHRCGCHSDSWNFSFYPSAFIPMMDCGKAGKLTGLLERAEISWSYKYHNPHQLSSLPQSLMFSSFSVHQWSRSASRPHISCQNFSLPFVHSSLYRVRTRTKYLLRQIHDALCSMVKQTRMFLIWIFLWDFNDAPAAQQLLPSKILGTKTSQASCIPIAPSIRLLDWRADDVHSVKLIRGDPSWNNLWQQAISSIGVTIILKWTLTRLLIHSASQSLGPSWWVCSLKRASHQYSVGGVHCLWFKHVLLCLFDGHASVDSSPSSQVLRRCSGCTSNLAWSHPWSISWVSLHSAEH